MAGVKRVVLACLLWPGAVAAGERSDEPAPLDRVLALAQSRALAADQVEWPAVEAHARQLQQATPGEEGISQAIAYVLASLKDGHSFYIPPRFNPSRPHGRPTPVDAAPAKPPIASADVVGGRHGRLTMRGWAGPVAEIEAATRTVRQALLEAVRGDGCGLVLDAAANTGGNMWPMMGGIAPLYDEGTLESFRDRRAGAMAVRVSAGSLYFGQQAKPDVIGLPPLPQRPRYIALLQSKATASSGEILLLGFRHQANVRSFGQRTAGATTANSSFPLSNGGLVNIATAQLLDRTGAVQQGGLIPDVETAQPLEEALRWLDERCGPPSARG